MADKVVQVPGVGNVAFPDSMSDDEIAVHSRLAYLRANSTMPSERIATDPAGAVLAKQGISGGTVPTTNFSTQPMQESSAPRIFKGATAALPAAGAIGGGLLGASATFGAGALIGAGLGGAAGEQGRLLSNRLALGKDETSPISKEGLASTGIVGGLSAAAEIPGAIAGTIGNKLLPRIAAAQSEKQVGDAIAGIRSSINHPLSQQMLLRDINSAAKQEAANLRTALATQGQHQVNVDSVVAGARQRAASVVQGDPLLKAAPKQLEITISAAKARAGITGNSATPQQLFDFMQELRAYKGDPGKVSGLVQDFARQAYQDSGQALRAYAPESDSILRRLTNYHAATDAVKNYGLGKAGAIAVQAAANPKTTAAISPLASALGAGAYEKYGKRVIGSLSAEFTK